MTNILFYLKSEKGLVNVLITLTLLYLPALLTNGVLGPFYDVFGVYPLVLLLLLLLIIFIKNEGIKFLINIDNIIFVIVTSMVLVNAFVTSQMGVAYYGVELVVAMIVFSIYRYCIKNNSSKENNVIATIVLLNLLLTFVGSIFYSSIDNTLLRLSSHMSKSKLKEYAGLKTTFLLGTFSTVYVSPFVILLSIDKLFNKKYYWSLIILISCYLMIFTSYSICIITGLLSIILYLYTYFTKRRDIKKSLLFTLLIIVTFSISGFIAYKSNILPYEVEVRINEIYQMIINKTLDINKLVLIAKENIHYGNAVNHFELNNLEDRIVRYITPLIRFVDNKGLYIPNTIVSGHSVITDMIGVLGFFVIGLFIWFAKALKYLYLNVSKELKLSVFFFFVISMLLNPTLTIDNIIMIFFIIPVLR